MSSRHTAASSRGVFNDQSRRAPTNTSSHHHRGSGSSAQASQTSRRQSINIADLLNPLDETAGRYVTSQSSQYTTMGVLRSRGGLHQQQTHRSHNAQASSQQARIHSGQSSPSLAKSQDSSTRSRSFRPAYTQEQLHFIWFLKVDLGYPWAEVEDTFTSRFGPDRGKGGLQCKFYRVLSKYGLPQVRGWNTTANIPKEYGMKAVLAKRGELPRYSWLDEYS